MQLDGLVLVERTHISQCFVCSRQYRASFIEKQTPSFCESHGLTDPFQQRQSDFIFKITNLTAHCRLGDMKVECGTRDVFSLGDADEIAQVPKFHGRRLYTF
jgi:hypothetical protein